MQVQSIAPVGGEAGADTWEKIVVFNIDTQCQSIALNIYHESMGRGEEAHKKKSALERKADWHKGDQENASL